jgi:hypothetical protein
MTEPTPTPGAPVPPPSPYIVARLRDTDLALADAADWIEQSLRDRQELAELLGELAEALRGYFILHPTHCADVLSARARALAERLKRGEE